MNAVCLVRQGPVYRREAFVRGLAAAGLNVSNTIPRRPGPEDLLVIWNRYADNDELARRYEGGGGRVIVAENGYLGYSGRSHRPLDPGGRRMYAVALGDHNGRGAWPWPRSWTDEERAAPPAPRFPELGVELKPWREGGRKVLVCAQRGIGSPGRAMPPGWAQSVAQEIRQVLRLPVIVRPHPGDNEPQIPLEQDLADAQACVIWASGAGVKALVEGVPVFYACPWWICAEGARRYQGAASLLHPVRNDVQRAAALERMSWAQWTCDELAAGEPFRLLLGLPYPVTKGGLTHA
jgi:hypothetical protein